MLFKAFAVDEFVRRRLADVVAAAPSGDVYLMLDETNEAHGRIDFPRTLRYRDADLVSLGFPHIAQGSLVWYNADYPLYYFRHLHPDYDVVVMVEYDAVPIVNLDTLVEKFRDEQIDFVGHQIGEAEQTYWWKSTLRRFYSPQQIRPYLICAALFSARAIDHLARRRKQQGSVGVSDAGEWPIGETFVGTELAYANFAIRELSYFGDVARYDWWPPIHERELASCKGEVFVHPVLAGRRYFSSLFKSGYVSGTIVCAKFFASLLRRRLKRWHRKSPSPVDQLAIDSPACNDLQS